MKKKIVTILTACFLGIVLLLTGCGSTYAESGSAPASSELTGNSSPGGNAPATSPGPVEVVSSFNPDDYAENVITIGIRPRSMGARYIHEYVELFNKAQSEYEAVAIEYESYDALVMDILRHKGTDLLLLKDYPLEIFSKKGILEDLTPYFENSTTLKLENINPAVRRAGTIDDKFTCLIPHFSFSGFLVEKGHTNNGAWTTEDYLALAEQYPDGMLNESIADPLNLLLNDLSLIPDNYINWQDYTCSFDSESFISFITKIKELSDRKYEIRPSATPAERLHDHEYLTYRTSIAMTSFPRSHMMEYMDIKHALGDEFEFAGYPGNGDTPAYKMLYEVILGINAASPKKQAAWAFLEYILSDPMQSESTGSYFPARMDILEQKLQEIVDYIPPENFDILNTNKFTEEFTEKYRPFTAQDKEIILNMVEHVERFSVMSTSKIWAILTDELKYYFEGSKSAKEVADLIQNRMTLYLMENQ